ncbi:hypothetical protein MKX08_001415 [Trichoderma sp. CBMAI-0020]|nr:hypothetical protein MKX08_001415 [Trichoderma sp. CBMAI-0020]
MPRQVSILGSIPEEEEVEQGGFPCINPTEIDLLMATALESPCYSGYYTPPTPNTIQAASQASILAPQPWYSNPVENVHIAYPHHYSSQYEYTPPYLQEVCIQVTPPSPSPASSTPSFHAAPSPTVLDDHNPHRAPNLLDFVKERTQTRLEKTGLSDNFFTKWAIVTENMYGGVIPPESKYSIPPFALPSYDGQTRLHFIGHSFGLSLAVPIGDIEKFLSRNLFIIMCLAFNIVPNPNLIFDDDDDNSRCGIFVSRPGKWTNPSVIEAVRLSISDEVGALATLVKKRASHILPDVSQTIKEMVWEEPALEDLGSRKLHEMAVKQMRENRPYSLLRNVVRPEDVIV